MSGRTRRLVLAAVVTAAIGAAHLRAEFIRQDIVDVPVDRIIKNLDQAVREQPDVAAVHVNLGRAHMMIYALKSDTLAVNRRDNVPATEPLRENVLPAARPAVNQGAAETAKRHLALARAEYSRAIALAPTNAFARLGYAWTLQEAGEKTAAIAAYRDAVRVAWSIEEKDHFVLAGWQSITQEATSYLIRLLDPVADRDEIAALRARTAKIDAWPRAITPIAIPLRDGLSAERVTNLSARVPFDLDGSGLRREWTWITPDAGWLVFDPHRRGEIRSALQMFGNVTFWLFWDDGYDALRALDDNHDGELRGAELDGLAIWQDANTNGVSEPGEVRPVAAWRIVALSCESRLDPRHADEIAFSPAGVVFADGTTRPTYDLVMHRR